MRDRGFNVELLDRAKAANCSAIMLTVDMPVQGLRRRDAKNGLSIPPRLTLKNAFDIAMKPTWALKVLMGKRRSFGNLEGRMTEGAGGSRRWPNGSRSSSIPPSRGKTSRGCASSGRARSSSRAYSMPRTRGSPWSTVSTPSWCRTTAAVSSTARARRSRRCPKS